MVATANSRWGWRCRLLVFGASRRRVSLGASCGGCGGSDADTCHPASGGRALCQQWVPGMANPGSASEGHRLHERPPAAGGNRACGDDPSVSASAALLRGSRRRRVRRSADRLLEADDVGTSSGGQFDPLVRNSVSEFPERPRVLQDTRFQHWCGGDQIAAAGAGGGLLAVRVWHYDEVDPGMDCQLSLPDGDIQATGGAIGWSPARTAPPSCWPERPHPTRSPPPAAWSQRFPTPCLRRWTTRPRSHGLSRSGTSHLRDPPGNDQPPRPHRRHRLQRARARLVIVQAQGRERIVRYDATGTKLGSTPLATSSVRRISMGAAVIAYAVGHPIVEMSTTSGRTRTLWRATRTPRLVTVGSGHVYWVEHSRRIDSIAA